VTRLQKHTLFPIPGKLPASTQVLRVVGKSHGKGNKTTVYLPVVIGTGCTSWCYPQGMKRATITLPDDLEQALGRFVQEQEVPVRLTAVVQAAVREYLGGRGYLRASSALHIRPAEHGSGEKDGSVSHDRYLASK
jgi:hypothetical protein